MEQSLSLTPTQLVDYCIIKIGRIPYSMETEKTVGEPLKEISGLLEQLKKVIVSVNDDV